MEKHRVIVGLGNPGKRYEFTRHNLGALVAKALANDMGWGFKEVKQFSAFVAKGKFADSVVHIILPTTYMNESGRSVRPYLDYYRLGTSELIVIVDDTEIPYGQLRLRPQGSSGGHNGLKSIESTIGTQNYIRLRMGIGKDLQQTDLADYVLDAFKDNELATLNAFINKGVEATKCLLQESITDVMNKVNKQE